MYEKIYLQNSIGKTKLSWPWPEWVMLGVKLSNPETPRFEFVIDTKYNKLYQEHVLSFIH